MTNISAYMDTIARHYWGEPTSTRGSELRWGTHGSKSVDLKKGTFYDHEAGEGGGVVDLVKMHEGAQLASLPDILERKFGIPRQTQKALAPTRWLAKRYDYFDSDGVLSYQVERYEPKTFRQRRPDGDKWVYSMDGVDALPYRLPDIMLNPDKVIVIVEGEKCADRVAEMGLLATSSHGGAGNWKPELNQYFKDRKVVIIPDNDQAGDKHARTVAQNLLGVAKEVRRVDLPNLADKQDVYDWINAGNDVSKLRQLIKTSEPIVAVEAVEPEPVQPQADVFLTYDENYLINMPPVEWLVDGVITKHGFNVIYGAPGTGKSFLAIDMAMSIAHNKPWQNRSTASGAILYIAGEGVGGLGKRVKAWRLYNGADNVGEMVVLPTAVSFREPDQVEKLMRTIDQLGKQFKCVVVDTVARALLGGEENSATDMGLFVGACDAIKAHCNCSLIAIHHSNKSSSAGINAMRGSSALAGAADTVINVQRDEDVVTATMEKQKDADPIEPMKFDMVNVAMIADTSIILKQQGGDAPKAKPRTAKLNKRQSDALQLLRNMIIDNGGKKVRIEAWHEAHKRDYVDLSPSARRDARNALSEKGAILLGDGYVWLSKTYE